MLCIFAPHNRDRDRDGYLKKKKYMLTQKDFEQLGWTLKTDPPMPIYALGVFRLNTFTKHPFNPSDTRPWVSISWEVKGTGRLPRFSGIIDTKEKLKLIMDLLEIGE